MLYIKDVVGQEINIISFAKSVKNIWGKEEGIYNIVFMGKEQELAIKGMLDNELRKNINKLPIRCIITKKKGKYNYYNIMVHVGGGYNGDKRV